MSHDGHRLGQQVAVIFAQQIVLGCRDAVIASDDRAKLLFEVRQRIEVLKLHPAPPAAPGAPAGASRPPERAPTIAEQSSPERCRPTAVRALRAGYAFPRRTGPRGAAGGRPPLRRT